MNTFWCKRNEALVLFSPCCLVLCSVCPQQLLAEKPFISFTSESTHFDSFAQWTEQQLSIKFSIVLWCLAELYVPRFSNVVYQPKKFLLSFPTNSRFWPDLESWNSQTLMSEEACSLTYTQTHRCVSLQTDSESWKKIKRGRERGSGGRRKRGLGEEKCQMGNMKYGYT